MRVACVRARRRVGSDREEPRVDGLRMSQPARARQGAVFRAKRTADSEGRRGRGGEGGEGGGYEVCARDCVSAEEEALNEATRRLRRQLGLRREGRSLAERARASDDATMEGSLNDDVAKTRGGDRAASCWQWWAMEQRYRSLPLARTSCEIECRKATPRKCVIATRWRRRQWWWCVGGEDEVAVVWGGEEEEGCATGVCGRAMGKSRTRD